MLWCAAVYLHNAQLRNLCGARLLNRLDIGRAAVVELDLREVRFGSITDIEVRSRNVRFTPKSGHRQRPKECPLCAKSRQSAPQQKMASVRSHHRWSTGS